MSWKFLVLTLLIFATIVVVKSLHLKARRKVGLEYKKLDVLFTPVERSFFGILKIAVSDDVEVFGKVRVRMLLRRRKVKSVVSGK